MKFSRLAVVASIVSAGCATQPPDNTYAFRPGDGTVQSVHQARVAVPGGTAAEQLGINMDDGTTQVINVQGAAFQPGERVTVTTNGRVLRP